MSRLGRQRAEASEFAVDVDDAVTRDEYGGPSAGSAGVGRTRQN